MNARSYIYYYTIMRTQHAKEMKVMAVERCEMEEHSESEQKKRKRDEEVLEAAQSGKRPRKNERFFWPTHRTLGYLSNDFYSKFEVDGVTFTSVDWYMWYQRAKAWSPLNDLAVLIREAETREKAMQLSRRCTSPGRGTAIDWESEKLKIMAKAVMRKFECSRELMNELLSTGGSQLLYAGKYDGYYGIGFMMTDAVERRDEWGMNYLGKILMSVRERLRERSQA
jgi:ribA/ribD-fused uncharacterized protein